MCPPADVRIMKSTGFQAIREWLSRGEEGLYTQK